MRNGGMALGHEAAVFLSILVGAIRPQFAVEIGTFIGYSSLAIARALPPGGRLLCCDVSAEWTSIAREHWAAAGVDDRIDLRLGPATETLASLPPEPEIDFAFIDADKTGYLAYYDELLDRLSPHGVIAVDNTMWGGRVIDERDTSAQTAALRQFNRQVSADRRTTNVTLPLGDGITLIARAR
jgi:caffeoyl-CoA O-methyltransferase